MTEFCSCHCYRDTPVVMFAMTGWRVARALVPVKILLKLRDRMRRVRAFLGSNLFTFFTLAVELWTSYLTTLNLSFLNRKMQH